MAYNIVLIFHMDMFAKKKNERTIGQVPKESPMSVITPVFCQVAVLYTLVKWPTKIVRDAFLRSVGSRNYFPE